MNSIKLKIGKKELGFSFGLAFMGELLDKTDLDISEVVQKMNKNPFKMIPMIMFYSASQYLERQGKEVDFTLFDFYDLIDLEGGVGSENVVKFLHSFTESMTKGVPEDKEPVDKDASKKK